MLFSKNVLLASLFASSASAANLRNAHRGLTECPETDPKLTCDIYKNGEVDAQFSSVEEFELKEFDPTACYDISCTAEGLNSSPEVKFFFNGADSHVSWTSPFNLGGSKVIGRTCKTLATTCDDLMVVIEAGQIPDPNKVNVGQYTCASTTITCSPPPPPTCHDLEPRLACYGDVNPGGKKVPTAGDDTVDEGKHQNPDGFYGFGYVDGCGTPICDGTEITIWSGLDENNNGMAIDGSSNFNPSGLSAYDASIKNLKSAQRPYQACDVVKMTQYADGKENREQKIGSALEHVRSHLHGSGDFVVTAVGADGGVDYAFCKVPKPPTRV